MNKRRPAKSKMNKPHEKEQLGDSDLEHRLLDSLIEPLRTTERRKQSLAATRESHAAIEQALACPVVLGGIAKAQNAFVVEQWPSLLRNLFEAAEQGQSWAWKILLDVAGVAEQLRAACGDVEAGSGAEAELGLPKEIRALLSRADEETEIPDSAAPGE